MINFKTKYIEDTHWRFNFFGVYFLYFLNFLLTHYNIIYRSTDKT